MAAEAHISYIQHDGIPGKKRKQKTIQLMYNMLETHVGYFSNFVSTNR